MQPDTRDLVVLSNEAGQAMLVAPDGWGGQPIPVGVMLRPTPGGVEVLGERGVALGVAPAEAEAALRGASEIFLGHATPEGVVTDGTVAVAFIGA